ncbi:MAG: hypothetical protein NTV70_17435 [Acidobacteria bacterium]|nr:hypothetical protein [Acidobacteriota bacterium]
MENYILFDFKSIALGSLVLVVAAPAWATPALFSAASVPALYSYPLPSPPQTSVIRNDNTAAAASVEAGDYYATGFAQSDYGVLKASASSYLGTTYNQPILYYSSQGLSKFTDDVVVNAPVGQSFARFVFDLSVAQVHNTGGDSELYFAASVISRPASGIGFLGTAHCGTSAGAPGAISYGGSYGYVYGTSIPLSATCALDAPVTPGAATKIEVEAFISLIVVGWGNPESLNATNTVKLISTGWVDGNKNFTPASFTGESGTTYPIISTGGAVPEPASGIMAASCLAAVLLMRNRWFR